MAVCLPCRAEPGGPASEARLDVCATLCVCAAHSVCATVCVESRVRDTHSVWHTGFLVLRLHSLSLSVILGHERCADSRPHLHRARPIAAHWESGTGALSGEDMQAIAGVTSLHGKPPAAPLCCPQQNAQLYIYIYICIYIYNII